MMATPVQPHKAMVAFGASALVVLLVAHLVVMATPLHDLVMDSEWSGTAASMNQAQDGVSLPPGVQLASVDDIGDCAIVWTVLARQAPGFPVAAVVVSTVSIVPVVTSFGPPPLPRTLSPPLSADWQALLQVFRI